jgi:hypothetical protein
VARRELIVITAKGRTPHFHRGCDHLRLEYFVEKVEKHSGKNGAYFAVSDVDEALAYWPSVADCWT